MLLLLSSFLLLWHSSLGVSTSLLYFDLTPSSTRCVVPAPELRQEDNPKPHPVGRTSFLDPRIPSLHAPLRVTSRVAVHGSDCDLRHRNLGRRLIVVWVRFSVLLFQRHWLCLNHIVESVAMLLVACSSLRLPRNRDKQLPETRLKSRVQKVMVCG